MLNDMSTFFHIPSFVVVPHNISYFLLQLMNKILNINLSYLAAGILRVLRKTFNRIILLTNMKHPSAWLKASASNFEASVINTWRVSRVGCSRMPRCYNGLWKSLFMTLLTWITWTQTQTRTSTCIIILNCFNLLTHWSVFGTNI